MIAACLFLSFFMLFEIDMQSFFAGGVTTAIFSISIVTYFVWRNHRLKKKRELQEEEVRRYIERRIIHFDSPGDKLRLLRRAEAVLTRRTNRIVLVIERLTDPILYLTVIKTAEAFGIQQIFIVDSERNHAINTKRELFNGLIGSPTDAMLAQLQDELTKTTRWLTIQTYATMQECIDFLRQEAFQIWVLENGQLASTLSTTDRIPDKVALIFQSEFEANPPFAKQADRRISFPLHGFTPSLNLGVLVGCVLQNLLSICPSAWGTLSKSDKQNLRLDWYNKLARSEVQRAEFLAIARSSEPPPYPFDDLRLPDEYWHKVQKKRIEGKSSKSKR